MCQHNRPSGGILKRDQLEAITSSVPHAYKYMYQFVRRNAYVEGHQESEVKRNTHHDPMPMPQKTLQPRKAPQPQQHEAAAGPSREDQKQEALLIYPNKPSEANVCPVELRTEIRPCPRRLGSTDLGLQRPELRPVRGGAVLLSTCEGIARLEKHLKTNYDLKKQLKAKRPYTRNL